MGTQMITTLYDWEAEQISEEMRSLFHCEALCTGHTIIVSGLNWSLEPSHIRAVCAVRQVPHAQLDDEDVFEDVLD